MKQIFTLLCLVFLIHQSQAQLIINEVLYDPSNSSLDGDANGDGVYDQEDDSFIEFYNPGPGNFDASGYQIWDDTTSGSVKFIAPAGTFIPPNGVWVVFGGGTLTGTFGGAVVQSADTSANGLNLNNSGEVIVIKDAQGNTVLTFDSDALSNNPNESYTRNPDITGVFEQHNDNTPILFSPGTRVDGTPFDTLFVAESIVVNGQGGVDSISTPGGTLQMEAMVMPTFADDQSVTWSVPMANGIATIDANGLLTGVGNGIIVVTATTNDGTNLSDGISISVTNQVVGLSNEIGQTLKLYPNPTSNLLTFGSDKIIDQAIITDVQGKILIEHSGSNTIDVSKLKAGTYFIRGISEGLNVSSVFIKE